VAESSSLSSEDASDENFAKNQEQKTTVPKTKKTRKNQSSTEKKAKQPTNKVKAPSPRMKAENLSGCLECGTHNTPLWRAGPDGRKSLCNRCGIRWMRGSSLTYKSRNSSNSYIPPNHYPVVQHTSVHNNFPSNQYIMETPAKPVHHIQQPIVQISAMHSADMLNNHNHNDNSTITPLPSLPLPTLSEEDEAFFGTLPFHHQMVSCT